MFCRGIYSEDIALDTLCYWTWVPRDISSQNIKVVGLLAYEQLSSLEEVKEDDCIISLQLSELTMSRDCSTASQQLRMLMPHLSILQ